MKKSRFGPVLLIASFTLLAGCQEALVRPTLAQPTLAISPSPLTAQPSTIAGFDWMVTFTLTVTEIAGTGADIDKVTALVSEAAGGATLDAEHAQVTTSMSSERLPANGTVTVDFTVAYTQLSGVRAAMVEARLQVIDDNVVRIIRAARANVE